MAKFARSNQNWKCGVALLEHRNQCVNVLLVRALAARRRRRRRRRLRNARSLCARAGVRLLLLLARRREPFAQLQCRNNAIAEQYVLNMRSPKMQVK